MATREMQLISRVIRTGNITDLVEWGITPEDFLTNEGRAMYNSIIGYYSMHNTAGAVIGEQAAQGIFPTFELCDDPSMTTPALCVEVRKTRIAIDLKVGLQRAIEMAEADPLAAVGHSQNVTSSLLNLGLGKSTDVRFQTALEDILIKYEMREKGIDLSCGQWPWQILNDATGGVQPEDYVIFYGRPKSFKSWVLAFLIACMFEQDKKAIIYTKEMTPENIFMRVAACVAQIDYAGLRMGKLSKDHRESLYLLRRMMQALRSYDGLICLSGRDAPAGGDTVPWLRSKVDHYHPDFVFIDGLYLMSDSKGAKKREERISNISRDLRQLGLDTHVPVIATLQANRKAAAHEEANLDELAYSDAISQDATLVIRVINEKSGPTLALAIGGAREFNLEGFRIHGIPATNFSFHSVLTDKELQRAASQEDKEPAARPKKGNMTADKSFVEATRRAGELIGRRG